MKYNNFIVNKKHYKFDKLTGEVFEYNLEEYFDEVNNYAAIKNKVKNIKYNKETDKILTITIELNSKCNLDCVYCYQIDRNSREEISDENINNIMLYISKVCDKTDIKYLELRFIGGEPLLSLKKLLLCYRRAKEICDINNIILNVHIDTNGTISFNKLLLEVENLEMVICLSLKEDHDINRDYSYERVVNNLYLIDDFLLNKVIIRYNVSDTNISDFEKFVVYIKKEFPDITSIMTAKIDDSRCMYKYRNNLTEKEFAIWNSTVAVDILIKYGYPIYHAFRGYLSKCQGYAKYSCKIYSNGKITVCDAMYEAEAKLTIKELSSNIELLSEKYREIKRFEAEKDKKCSKCDKIVQCGGALFCRGKGKECDYQNEFNENEFIKTYIKHYQMGNANYFVNII